MRRLALAGALLVTAFVFGGCAASEPSTPLPEGVSVELRQQRDDVAARNAQLTVRNNSADAVTIGSVSVTDPRFDGAAERVVPRTTRLPAGSSVNIRIALPPMDCTVDVGSPRVEVEVTSDADGLDAEVAVAEVALPDPTDVIGPIHVRECLAQKVAESVTLTWSSFKASTSGEPGTLVLRIDRVDADVPVQIVGVQETPLLAAATGGPGWKVDESEQVRLAVVPNRCDPHVVQEDKRGTIFTLDVMVNGEAGAIELPVSPELKGQIMSWVGQWCGFGG